MREKLNKLRNTNKASDSLWKPEEGKQVVRIVPSKATPDNPFVELYFHYINGKTYLSPRTYGRPDPIADFADKLRSTGDKDDWLNSRQFAPKMRTYVPVVVRGKESDGTKWWAFGKTVYSELLAVIADPDYGDITDPTSGRDVVVEFTPQEKSDTNFAKTAIRCKPNQTPITNDATLLGKILNEQPDITSLYNEPSPEELKNVLEAYLNPSSTPSIASSKPAAAPTMEESVSPTASKARASAKASDDVATEFDKLFEE